MASVVRPNRVTVKVVDTPSEVLVVEHKKNKRPEVNGLQQ